jgi:hypothetical protein
MLSMNQGAGKLHSFLLNSWPNTRLSIHTGRLKVPWHEQQQHRSKHGRAELLAAAQAALY